MALFPPPANLKAEIWRFVVWFVADARRPCRVRVCVCTANTHSCCTEGTETRATVRPDVLQEHRPDVPGRTQNPSDVPDRREDGGNSSHFKKKKRCMCVTLACSRYSTCCIYVTTFTWEKIIVASGRIDRVSTGDGGVSSSLLLTPVFTVLDSWSVRGVTQHTAGPLRRNTQVPRLRKCSAGGRGCATSRQEETSAYFHREGA